MSTPDHVENTGDNLRHAAEVQKQAQDDQSETRLPPDQQSPTYRMRFVRAALLPGTGLLKRTGPSNGYLYTVNGAVINENVRGQPHNLFVEDAIQETTVQVAGISAEFGNFTGGVVNAITKSGGNEFSGSFRDTFLNPTWTGSGPTAILT